MTHSSRALGALLLAVSIFVTGCSGGSSAGASSAALPPTQRKIGKIKATVYVPPKRRQSAREIAYLKAQQLRHAHGKKPHFLSGGATELDFTFQSNNGSPATAADQAIFDFTIYLNDSTQCSGNATTGYTCTFVAPAPVGYDTYGVKSEECSANGSTLTNSCASVGGALTLLGGATATADVPLNTVVLLAFTLGAVVGSIDWAPVTYANVVGPNIPTSQPLPAPLWLVNANGSAIPNYQPTPAPGAYSCLANAGSGTGNGCYEPVAKTYSMAYGVVLQVRDPNGALILPSSGGGTIYQTPLYLDSNGNAVTIGWSCSDPANGSVASTLRRAHRLRANSPAAAGSLSWETGSGPYTNNANAPAANESFNSPVVAPQQDADGGNTFDANGDPVTAVGNNGAEMNWDGVDQPQLNYPDSCEASTSTGLTTALDWYAGLGEGGVTLSTPPPLSTTVLSMHPAIYYQMDETSGTTANDSSGNNRNGTIDGSVTIGVPGLAGAGPSDLAYSFPNTLLPTVGWTVPGGQFAIAQGIPTTLTFVMLVKGKYSGGYANLAQLVTPANTSHATEVDLGFDGGYPAVYWAGGLTGPNALTLDKARTVSDGTTHFVTWEVSNGTVQDSLDGAPLDKVAATPLLGSRMTQLVLGEGYILHQSVVALGGTYDDMALFSGALTDAQICQLATAAGYGSGCATTTAE